MGLARLALVAALFALGSVPSPAEAQDAIPKSALTAPAAGTETVDPAELEKLIRTLEDQGGRQRLIAQLRLLQRAQEEASPVATDGLGAALLATVSDRVARVSQTLAEAGKVAFNVPALLRWLVNEARTPEARDRWLETAVKVLIVLGVAIAAEFAVKRLLLRPRQALARRRGEGLPGRVAALLGRAVIELLPIIAFAAAANGTLPLTEPRPATRLILLALINASVLARAVMALAQVLLSPGEPRLRPLPLGDETANYAFIWTRRLAYVAIYGYIVVEAALLLGVPIAVYEVLMRAGGLLLALMLVVLILQNRAAVEHWIGAGNGARGLRLRVADLWHVVAILAIVALYIVWSFGIPGGFQYLARAIVASVVILVAARLVVAALRKALARGFALGDDLKRRYPGLETRANRYLPVLSRILVTVVWLAAMFLLLQAWGFGVFDWLTSDLGREALQGLVSIALVVGAAVVISELIDAAIERYLEEHDAEGRPVERSARARTLLPLFRNAARVLLGLLVLLIVLSELGLNIGPLLAGAGVVGLAVGFGAQTLVKDVITGIFILIEESMSVGDVVDLGGHSGVIEGMTIRSVRVRDVSGAVHTIPFSSVTTVVNMTKDFAFAVFSVNISYEEVVDKAVAAMERVGHELQADPVIAPSILAPIEVFGLDAFGEQGMRLQGRMKTRAGRQWAVTREFNRRIKQTFDGLGISMPHAQKVMLRSVPAPAT